MTEGLSMSTHAATQFLSIPDESSLAPVVRVRVALKAYMVKAKKRTRNITRVKPPMVRMNHLHPAFLERVQTSPS